MTKKEVRVKRRNTGKERRTNITPNWNYYVNISRPDDSVDAINNIRNEKPGYNRKSGDVACSPVPRERDENEEGGDECADRELKMHAAKSRGEMENQDYSLPIHLYMSPLSNVYF